MCFGAKELKPMRRRNRRVYENACFFFNCVDFKNVRWGQLSRLWGAHSYSASHPTSHKHTSWAWEADSSSSWVYVIYMGDQEGADSTWLCLVQPRLCAGIRGVSPKMEDFVPIYLYLFSLSNKNENRNKKIFRNCTNDKLYFSSCHMLCNGSSLMWNAFAFILKKETMEE